MTLFLACMHAGILVVLLANLIYLGRQRQPAPSDLPAISILIPARNEAENLGRLLPTLLGQDYPEFEVIVYDDGSEDETWTVLQGHEDARLRPLRGDGPPPGWVGKVHALYQATRHASGDRLLFLDADTALADPQALRRIVARHEAMPPASVLTGLPRLRGGGLLLVSLVPNAILGGLPWPMVRLLRTPSLSALNGQCWMIDAATYFRLEPHQHHPDEVLEDVMIGRYLKREGLTPVLADLQGEVSVYMYDSLGEAWRGFRKNAYLIMGGTPLAFAFLFPLFLFTYTLAPLFSPWLLASLYGIKLISDRRSGFPLWVTLLTPIAFLLGSLLQLDSALSHLTGRVDWKGRPVA